MYTMINRMVATLAIVFALGVTVAAQSTILVVDQTRVMRDSKVGKHIQAQLEAIGSSMDAELKSQAAPLKSESDKLIAELQGMSAEALKSRPDLTQRAQSFQEKRTKAAVEARYKQAELAATERKALAKVNGELAKILEALVKEKNADVVLDRSMVIYGAKADVTDTVIQRLNSRMSTVAVTRERLPRKT